MENTIRYIELNAEEREMSAKCWESILGYKVCKNGKVRWIRKNKTVGAQFILGSVLKGAVSRMK